MRWPGAPNTTLNRVNPERATPVRNGLPGREKIHVVGGTLKRGTTNVIRSRKFAGVFDNELRHLPAFFKRIYVEEKKTQKISKAYPTKHTPMK